MKRFLTILLLSLCLGALAQLNVGSPFFVAGVLKPAAAGGGEPTLGYTAGLVGHWKANALSLSDNDPVSTWTATVGQQAVKR